MKNIITCLLLASLLSGATKLYSQTEPTIRIKGQVIDITSQKPINRVTIQLVGQGLATLTNEEGRFKLFTNQNRATLKISHIGYRSLTREIVCDTNIELGRIELQSLVHELTPIRVYNELYDPAQEIIVEAIRRKAEILSRLKSYKNDAYVKFIVRDESNEDSAKIFLITESQTSSYWQYPDQYKEVLTARRQSANLEAENNFVAVGELLNFNKNRIEIGQYRVISPTADDALDYYNYYMLDTIKADGRDVYLIEIEPKNQSDPLFGGRIQIVDSTYDVILVDLSVNEGVYLPMISKLRYYQRMVLFLEEFWSPVEISFSGLFTFEIPLPGIPSVLSFEHLASLHSFEFEPDFPAGTFNEYEFEILETADDFDSASWQANQMIELTEEELEGYRAIDSVEKKPQSIAKKMLGVVGGATALLLTGGSPDLFHYNRVEGTYFGLGLRTRRLLKKTDLWGSAGYSHQLQDWQYRFGFRKEVWARWRLRVGAEVKEKVTPNRSLTTPASYNATLLALWAKYDPHNYYLEKGYSAGFSFRPIAFTRLGLTYHDYEQSSLTTNTDYSVKRREREPRVNPSIMAGQFRSVEVFARYDSRGLIKNKGVERYGFARRFFRVRASMEQAHPDLANSDFNFRRYQLKIYAQMGLAGSSQTAIEASVGYSERNLPPQKFFAIDYGDGVMLTRSGFNTLNENPFYGDRAASLYLNHDFGRTVFDWVPFLNRFSLGLSAHGGAFWSDFEEMTQVPTDYQLVARSAYSEIGFSLYNLTPFISPLNLTAGVTWQLSDYDQASRYQLHVGFKL